MQNDGRVTRFLRACRKAGECFYDDLGGAYVFFTGAMTGVLEEKALQVFPKQRRIVFIHTQELYKGEKQGWDGEYYDDYDTILLEDVDRKNLSSAEAAKMLLEYISKHDDFHEVSEQNLNLLK